MTTNEEIMNSCEHYGSYILVSEVERLMNKARNDERRKVLDEQWESDKKRIAKQIFDELDSIAEVEYGMDLYSVLVQNGRNPKTTDKLRKMGL